MGNTSKLKVVAETSTPLDELSIEQIIGRPFTKPKLTPPQFKDQLVDFSNKRHLANALNELSREDNQTNQ